MPIKLNNNLRLGILGGGQLAWMLTIKSQSLGLPTSVLSPQIREPAAQFNPLWSQGDPTHPEQLKAFSRNLDILTFESEFYDVKNLRAGLKNFKGYIFPSLDALATLQDRLTQKQSLVESHLPTSPFIVASDSEEIQSFFRKHKKVVAKVRRNGYDGYGTYILKDQKSLDHFLKANISNLNTFLFEKFIPFKKEMALQVARSRSGDIRFLPLVTTVQKNNKCFYVTGPARLPATLLKGIKKWLHRLDYVGVMGVEFFMTSKGLIINEIAPRVHNTGHHSLDSCTVDQFTLHWLCALQDKLPEPELKTKSFIMLNLLGTSDRPVRFPAEIQGSLYWYRKSNRPGRKLGHINWVGKSQRALVTRALQHLKKWVI